MKKATLTLFTFLIAVSLYTQQWTGPNGGNITTSYNVGIGTTIPTEKLHINEGNINILGLNTSRYLRFTEVDLLGGFINYDGAANVFNIGVNNVSSDDPSNDYNSISILRSNGYVGIGTTNPNEKLHINEGNINVHGFNTSRFLRFTESSLQGGFINYDGTSNVLNIGVNNISSNDPSNDHNAISVLRANGYVGIGTTSPDSELAVNGNIHAKEVKVDLVGWPDYVFKSDYELPSLKEVEDHIKEKGHLQDIPSAQEVTENGIRLGEMDAKLLQKIEELMLYTINQQKEIQMLKVQNQDLQKQLNQIQSR